MVNVAKLNLSSGLLYVNPPCSTYIENILLDVKQTVHFPGCGAFDSVPFTVVSRSLAYRPFSKMAAENSNKLKLAKIKNVYQH